VLPRVRAVGYRSGPAVQRSNPQALYVSGGLAAHTCPAVPPRPPDADLHRNMETASKSRNPLWFYGQVRNSGPWDFKQSGPEYEAFGNFHYGATGGAMGWRRWELLRFAGWAQRRAGTSREEWGHPLGGAPYGDDPADQALIRDGYLYHKMGCFGNGGGAR
jgi:hypothetical protein